MASSWLEQYFVSIGMSPAEAQSRADEVGSYGTRAYGTRAEGGGTGGTSPTERETADGITQPPAGTYDPTIEQERDAVNRGLEDTLFDTKRERKRLKKDLKTELKDIAVNLKRGRTDIKLSRERGLEDIGTAREGLEVRAQRGEEDFMRGLDDLTRSYSRRAGVQTEATNAAGVAAGGSAAASAAAREEGFAHDREPLDISRQRLGEDIERALGGLGTDEARLLEDTGTDLTRLGQDTRHDRRLVKREGRQSLQDIHTERQRARREGSIANADLIESEVFDARQRHPGAFTNTGRRRAR